MTQRTSEQVQEQGQAPSPTSTVEAELRWTVSRHARRLCNLAIVALAFALLASRPGLVAISLPALVLLGASAPSRPKTVRVLVAPSTKSAYEGQQVPVAVDVTGHEDYTVELALRLGGGARAFGELGRARSSSAVLSYQVTRWGVLRPGAVEVVLSDRYRIFEGRANVALPEVTCYPLPARCPIAPVLGRLGNRAGDHASRLAGEGAEFTGVRQYVPGDRQRSINWAATTRLGRLQVNSFAAERSQDVVVVVDATSDDSDLRSGPMDLAMRGALGVARTYLDARDRVGIVIFGANVLCTSWLVPGMGARQFYRILGSVLTSRARWYQGCEVSKLPGAVLPPGAAVIAFSPLLEMRFAAALRDLRERRFAVVAVDVLGQQPHKRDLLERRLWRLERRALEFSLRELGITLVNWDGQSALSLPVRYFARARAGPPR